MNIKLWEKELKEEFCLLFRAHYEVGKVMQIEENDFIKNMTDYPSLSELMIASDILVSDYSSIIFDYCVMDKAVYLFCYDYDLYEDKRGMYFDIRNYFQNGINENEVIELLKNMDKEKELICIKAFREKYLNYYGNAVEASLDYIYENIK
jgi:CDP-glycerol glycerophosphotransferase